MPNTVRGIRNFRALIRALAKKHHGGHYYPMAKRVGVASATVDQWQAGVIKEPSIDSVVKLCAAYDLELLEVMQMLGYRAPSAPIGGGSGNDGTPPVLRFEDAVPLIGRWWPLRWGWLGGSGLTPCPA